MQEEFSFGEVPAPGEPLVPRIAPENKRVLEQQLRERADRMKGKLSPREIKKLLKRHEAIRKALHKANYKALLSQRWEIYQEYQELIHRLEKASGERLARTKERGREVVAEGRKLNTEIAKLKPLADEFDSINRRLRGHKLAVEYERQDKENYEKTKKECRNWEAIFKACFAQHPRAHHVRINGNNSKRTIIPKFKRIIFKEDEVLYLIRTTYQGIIGRFFGRWASALPYGVDITALTSEEMLTNLSASLNRKVTIRWSKTGRNVSYAISRLDSPDGIPARVPYWKIPPYYPVADHKKTPWAAGVTTDRKIQFFNFEEYPHILIAGASGGGKSNHINQMIATLITMNKPSELQLVLIDNKGGIEFTHWAGVKHLLFPMVKQAADVPKVLTQLRKIMETRLALFEKVKAKNLASYNQKMTDSGNEDEKLPRIVAITDEMSTLIGLGELTEAIHREFRVISSQGRAVGLNLIICTQHPSVDTLPGWIKTNMSLRVASKMPNHTASMVIIDSVNAASLPDIPGRMIFRRGGFEVTAQSPYITDDEIAEAVAISKQFPDIAHSELVELTDVAAAIPVQADVETADNDEEIADEIPEEAAEIVAQRRADRLKPKFGREALLDLTLESLGGKISAMNASKLIDKQVASLHAIRKIVESLLTEAEENGWIIVHRAKTYELVKTVGRGSYVMREVKSAGGANQDTQEVVTSTDESHEDELEAA